MTAVTTVAAPPDMAEIERVLIGGDLAKLSPEQRVRYYNSVCQSIGLNPLSRPFDYITLSGRLTLYAKKDATDQLRRLRGVSCRIVSRGREDDIYLVVVEATDRDGRTDTSTGAVAIAGLRGEALANAYMRCETKAKRRATLSICGLGWLDETEVGAIPDAATVRVDHDTGEIVEPPAARIAPAPAPAPRPAPNPARDRLAGAIRAALKRGWEQHDMIAAMRDRYGVEATGALSAAQAAEFAAWLDADGLADGDIAEQPAEGGEG